MPWSPIESRMVIVVLFMRAPMLSYVYILAQAAVDVIYSDPGEHRAALRLRYSGPAKPEPVSRLMLRSMRAAKLCLKER